MPELRSWRHLAGPARGPDLVEYQRLDRPVVPLQRGIEHHRTTLRLHADHHLDRADDALVAAVDAVRRHSRHHLVGADRQLGHVDERLRLLDPARVLARGWSITTTDDGRALRSLADLAPGERLTTRVADGRVTSTVVSVDPDPPSEDRR